MASIVEKKINKGVQFQVRYRVNGAQRTKTFTSKGFTQTAIKKAEAEANRFAKEIEAQTDLGLAKDESRTKFEVIVNHVYKKRFDVLRETTKANYKIYKKRVIDKFGSLQIRNINPMMIEEFLYDLSGKFGKRVLQTVIMILNDTFSYAYKKDMISENPMEKVDFEFPKQDVKIKKVKPIKEDVLEMYLELLKNENKKYYLYAKLMRLTGMRPGEAQAFQFSDLDYEKRTFIINKNLNRNNEIDMPKKNKWRYGVLHDALLDFIEFEVKPYIAENKAKFGDAYQDNGLICCNEDGSYLKYSAIRSFFRRLDDKVDEKIRAHRFRHTFTSDLIVNKNLNPKVVQKLLGHQRISTTLDIYTDLIGDEYSQEVHEQLNEAFTEKVDNRTTNIQQKSENLVM